MRKKIGSCPLGSTCSQLKQDDEGPYMEVCPWLIEFSRRDRDGNEVEVNEKCGIAWNAIFAAQQSDQLTGVQRATESFRNDVVRGQEITNTIMASATNKRITG